MHPAHIHDIRLGDVVRATEPDFALVECFQDGNRCLISRGCSLPDGHPLFAPGTDIGALDAEVAGQLIEAVNAPRPTSPAPSDGSGASEALSRG